MSIMSDLTADFQAVGKSNYSFKNAGNLSTACQWGKVAAVALCVAAVVGAIFSGPIGMFVLGVAAIGLYDCYKVLDNIQEIADRNSSGRTLSESTVYIGGDARASITRGTIFARPISGLIK